jgi:hypothetical protein
VTILAGCTLTAILFRQHWFNSVTAIFFRLQTGLLMLMTVGLFLLLSTTAFWPEGTPLRKRYAIGYAWKSDLTKMHEYIRTNTPIDAVFLTLPDDESFLCEAQRSLPVEYKGVLHEPFFLLPWYEHFQGVYGVGFDSTSVQQHVVDRANAIYPYRADTVIVSPINIDYRIWDISKTPDSMYRSKTIIFQSGPYILTGFTNRKINRLAYEKHSS